MKKGNLGKTNANKDYSSVEYNLIFNVLVFGISTPAQLARAMGRSEAAIRSAFRRICFDATAYEDTKEYKVHPLIRNKNRYINFFARLYIEGQLLDRGKDIEDVAQRLGMDIKTLQNYLDNLKGDTHGSGHSRTHSDNNTRMLGLDRGLGLV